VRFIEFCCSRYDRGRYVSDRWVPAVARGVRGERHMSVGRYVEPRRMRYCVVPHIYLEYEQGDLEERLVKTREMLEALNTDCHVRFSGNKSFHVALPCGALGIGEMLLHAHIALYTRLFVHWSHVLWESFPGPLDEGLFDPRHLIRMVGSQHEKTGLFVVELTGEEIMRLGAPEIVRMASEPRVVSKPDPFGVSVSAALRSRAERVFDITRAHWEGGETHGTSLERQELGIAR
jgi:hypothetical protein